MWITKVLKVGVNIAFIPVAVVSDVVKLARIPEGREPHTTKQIKNTLISVGEIFQN